MSKKPFAVLVLDLRNGLTNVSVITLYASADKAGTVWPGARARLGSGDADKVIPLYEDVECTKVSEIVRHDDLVVATVRDMKPRNKNVKVDVDGIAKMLEDKTLTPAQKVQAMKDQLAGLAKAS